MEKVYSISFTEKEMEDLIDILEQHLDEIRDYCDVEEYQEA